MIYLHAHNHSPSDSLRCLTEYHAPLLMPNTFASEAQKQENKHRSNRDAGLSTESDRRPRLCYPLDLDVRRHKAGPISAGTHPSTYFARSLGVAVEQVGIDGCRHDHDANALYAAEDGKDHVVPAMLESEA